VAGGIAEYFDVDPTLIRLIWIVLAIAGGFGLPAYIIAWIIMPESPVGRRRRRDLDADPPAEGDTGAARGTYLEAEDDEDDENVRRSSDSGYWVFGLILVVLGFFLLLRNFIPWLHLGRFWPVLIIFLGALLLAGAFRGRSEREE
jgi:phage shock protein C